MFKYCLSNALTYSAGSQPFYSGNGQPTSIHKMVFLFPGHVAFYSMSALRFKSTWYSSRCFFVSNANKKEQNNATHSDILSFVKHVRKTYIINSRLSWQKVIKFEQNSRYCSGTWSTPGRIDIFGAFFLPHHYSARLKNIGKNDPRRA